MTADSATSESKLPPLDEKELKASVVAEQTSVARGASAWWSIIWVIAPAGLADVLVGPLMDHISPQSSSAPVVYACFGLIAGQVALVHIGLVFGAEVFWKRFLIAWSCLLAALGMWFLGLTSTLRGNTYYDDRLVENLLRVVCSLPLISLAMQLPLWLARVTLGWKFKRKSVANAVSPPVDGNTQLTIRGLLVATAFIAVSLGVARFAPQPERDGAMRLDFWVGVGLFGGAAAIAATFCIVPIVAIFAQRRSLAVVWSQTLLYAFLAEFIVVMTVYLGLFSFRIEMWDILGYTTTTLCLAVTIAGGLSLVRWSGHELRGSRP